MVESIADVSGGVQVVDGWKWGSRECAVRVRAEGRHGCEGDAYRQSFSFRREKLSRETKSISGSTESYLDGGQSMSVGANPAAPDTLEALKQIEARVEAYSIPTYVLSLFATLIASFGLLVRKRPVKSILA
jgi:hypothetical protein